MYKYVRKLKALINNLFKPSKFRKNTKIDTHNMLAKDQRQIQNHSCWDEAHEPDHKMYPNRNKTLSNEQMPQK
jgi:hypothetical protein